jgi:hypothetical protein
MRTAKYDIHNSGQKSAADEINNFVRRFSDLTGAAGRLKIAEEDYSTTTSITIAISSQNYDTGDTQDEISILDTIASGDVIKISSANVTDRNVLFKATGAHASGAIPVTFQSQGAGSSDGGVANFSNNEELAITIFKGADGLVAPQIIGGVTLSSSSNTNILNGTYVILADTTTVTSVTSGIGQDSNWTLEVTQAGITNQKGVVTFTGNLEKNAGGGVNYDIAIFKNGSIVSESEQIDQKLESGGKGQSVTVMAITEFSTNDTFDIRVAGNGTADDIFCGGGSLYIQ